MIARVGACALVVLLTGTAAHADDDGFIGRERPRLEIDDCPVVPQVLPPGYVPWSGIPGDVDPRKWCANPTHAQKPECFVLSEGVPRYTRGSNLYQQGDYEGAISEYVQFYCLLAANPVEDSYSVLKMVGLAYERMIAYDKAIAYYERYVVAIPPCAATDRECKRISDAERLTMSSRIQVMQRQRSVVQVATEPPGATVVIASEAGPQATGRDEAPLHVTAGSYRMRVEKPGFEPIAKDIVVGIGRPYSFSFRLTPQRGRLRVQAVPGDAKILIDDRPVGIGTFDGEVTVGEHRVRIEAPGRLAREQTVEVLDGTPGQLSVELAPPRQVGRRQLIAASTLVGAALGLSAGSATASSTTGGLGFVLGIGVGAAGSYFLVPDDLALGESSYIITTTAAGMLDGALFGRLLADGGDDTARSQAIGAGVIVGATLAATTAVITASGLEPSAGDAAVYNSGAVWGAAAGGLFTVIFSGSSRVQYVIALTGLNVGLLSGGLIARGYEFSRRRVVYIDVAGLAGITVGAALSALTTTTFDVDSQESTAHFALGGMVVGLGLGVYVTRNLDLPKLPKVIPQLTPGRDEAGGTSWMLSLGGSL